MKFYRGYTGVVATLDTGKEGPTIGMRFDIDANGIEESYDEDHRPNKEGFRSKTILQCMLVDMMDI